MTTNNNLILESDIQTVSNENVGIICSAMMKLAMEPGYTCIDTMNEVLSKTSPDYTEEEKKIFIRAIILGGIMDKFNTRRIIQMSLKSRLKLLLFGEII